MHTHSPAATALSALVDEVPAVHYYVAMFGGPTVPVAPYATYGTDELARNVVQALRDRTGCLMGNHGAVTVGPDLRTAQDKSTYLEWLCDVYLRASSAGTPRLLSAAEIGAVGGENGWVRPDPADRLTSSCVSPAPPPKPSTTTSLQQILDANHTKTTRGTGGGEYGPPGRRPLRRQPL